MENYIIRIYRREKGNCPKCVGTVEKVGQEGKQVFTHVDELWGILNATGRLPKRKIKGEMGDYRLALRSHKKGGN